MKNLFHIDSIHCHDFSTDTVSSKPFFAEPGFGCVLMEKSGPERVKNILVNHVIGDFKPLWSFFQHFADYLLIEDSAVEKESFRVSWLTADNQTSVSKLIAFPFICV